MTVLDALHLLIANRRTVGLADKAKRLCSLGLISPVDKDAIITEIEDREAVQ